MIPEPRGGRIQFLWSDAEYLIGDIAQRVGDEHLLAQADDETPHALDEVVAVPLALRELRGDVLVADDRSGDKLWEQQDVKPEAVDASLRRRVAAVDVDQVGDRMEGEEGNPQRQRNRGQRDSAQAECAEDDAEIGDHEVGVLEHREQRQVAGNGEGEPPAPCDGTFRVADFPAKCPVECDRGEYERNGHAFAPHIEHQTCHEQHAVAPATRHGEIRREHQGQEQEQEDGRCKDHAVSFRSRRLRREVYQQESSAGPRGPVEGQNIVRDQSIHRECE